MNGNSEFAFVLGAFILLVWGALLPMLMWAFRNHQFLDQDRARHLALLSGPPKDDGPGPDAQPGLIQDGNMSDVSH